MTREEIKFPKRADVRRRREKTQFLYVELDESVENPENDYRINFLNVLIYQAIHSISTIFKDDKVSTDLCFPLEPSHIHVYQHSKAVELKKQCLSLQRVYCKEGMAQMMMRVTLLDNHLLTSLEEPHAAYFCANNATH